MNARLFSCALTGALLFVFGTAAARDDRESGSAAPGADGARVRVEARFVDRASGVEAAWGATGQVLVPGVPGETALAAWGGARVSAASESRQSVAIPAGGCGSIRIGEGIPYAGWFFRYGKLRGYLDTDAEWREVGTSLHVEAAFPGADGGVRLAFTPEFGYLNGRTWRSVVFPDQRAEIILAEGAEVRLAVPGGQTEFYQNFLAGYDALRRVRPVDLVLRASVVRAEEAGNGSP